MLSSEAALTGMTTLRLQTAQTSWQKADAYYYMSIARMQRLWEVTPSALANWPSRVLLRALCPIHFNVESCPQLYINVLYGSCSHTFLGLLAKIKCSICSLEFDNSNGGHCPPCYLTYFSGGLPNSSACTAGLAAWPWHCTTALAEHPSQQSMNTITNHATMVQ